jgi:hypothetical protein
MHPLREADPERPFWQWPGADAPPPMDHAIGGRKPSQYSDAMARIILARIEDGEAVTSIAADPDMPAYKTIYDWRKRHPRFGRAWAEMRADEALRRRRAAAGREANRAAWEKLRAGVEGRAPRRKAGRRSTYTSEVGRAYCALIFQGLTLRQASARPGMPDRPMVYRWLRNHPQFREWYREAMWLRDQEMSDRIMEVVDRVTPENLRETKRIVKQLEAKAAALRPKVWTGRTDI